MVFQDAKPTYKDTLGYTKSLFKVEDHNMQNDMSIKHKSKHIHNHTQNRQSDRQLSVIKRNHTNLGKRIPN